MVLICSISRHPQNTWQPANGPNDVEHKHYPLSSKRPLPVRFTKCKDIRIHPRSHTSYKCFLRQWWFCPTTTLKQRASVAHLWLKAGFSAAAAAAASPGLSAASPAPTSLPPAGLPSNNHTTCKPGTATVVSDSYLPFTQPANQVRPVVSDSYLPFIQPHNQVPPLLSVAITSLHTTCQPGMATVVSDSYLPFTQPADHVQPQLSVIVTSPSHNHTTCKPGTAIVVSDSYLPFTQPHNPQTRYHHCC